MIDSHFEGLLTERKEHHGTGKGFAKGFALGGRSRVTIDILPDLALLRTFDFYLHDSQIEAWHTLVHVCRNWRIIVFGSPRRLGVRLICKANTPIKEKLDVWPHLPISVVSVQGEDYTTWGLDNIVAALEHNDRVYDLDLSKIPNLQLKKVLPVMQQPFPALTHLVLESDDLFDDNRSTLPASFLGGSAPCLQSLFLDGILFPGLTNLLLSTTHLVHLFLLRIPYSGYISPEAMVTCLSGLTRLDSLCIAFEFPRSPSGRRPPRQRRIVLPVLTKLIFIGSCEYMEDLVAQIDTPLLDELDIMFFDQDTFNTPELTQFVSRTPNYKAPRDVLFQLKDVYD